VKYGRKGTCFFGNLLDKQIRRLQSNKLHLCPMKLKLISAVLFSTLLALLLIQCSGGAKTDEVTDTGKPIYLDTLMRHMHEDAKALKALLEAGEVPDSSFIAMHRSMHTAIPTNPKVKGEVFEAYVAAYLGSLEHLVAPGNFTRTHFNSLVETCIACHSTYCTGPIPVIKKLHLPEEEEAESLVYR
jgi:hypothetical protein